ncbi:MAG: hypothetical protein ACI9U0_000093, partial [Flavobacteriales bacterium]
SFIHRANFCVSRKQLERGFEKGRRVASKERRRKKVIGLGINAGKFYNATIISSIKSFMRKGNNIDVLFF